jgi:hypothetical protein
MHCTRVKLFAGAPRRSSGQFNSWEVSRHSFKKISIYLNIFEYVHINYISWEVCMGHTVQMMTQCDPYIPTAPAKSGRRTNTLHCQTGSGWLIYALTEAASLFGRSFPNLSQWRFQSKDSVPTPSYSLGWSTLRKMSETVQISIAEYHKYWLCCSFTCRIMKLLNNVLYRCEHFFVE